MRSVLILALFCLLSTFYGYGQIDDCSVCGYRPLSSWDIQGKGLEELSFLRNEIYARKGYIFSNPKYERYFSSESWYTPASSNDRIRLTDIETLNVEFLKKEEAKLQKCRNFALRDLKELKSALKSNSYMVISKYIGQIKEKDIANNAPQELNTILQKIDLDDIHWGRQGGLYRVTIDNGYSISIYSISFEGDKVQIGLSDPASHSETFGDFDDGYSDYQSESEFSVYYIFDMTENGLVFRDVWMAG